MARTRRIYLRGVNFGRDCREPDLVADVRNVVAGDPSPDGKGPLEIVRGIEVGHVFALGSVYSQAMGATYLDAQGQSHVMEMGCYGIGVTRVVAAAIEQNHDARGIVWPLPMAPFAVAIAPVGYDRNEAVNREVLHPGGSSRVVPLDDPATSGVFADLGSCQVRPLPWASGSEASNTGPTARDLASGASALSSERLQAA